MADPITVERFVKELEKLKFEMDAGNLASGQYDQRLSRTIQELRERGLEGDREAVNGALADCLERGVITNSVHDHLEKRLGLDA
jgi:hypothetical protein